jgi:nicotinate-nucleotide adenylyltransferase
MRVALFGGSFNPPHVAHQLVALYVLETARVDQLWMIPCFKHPFEKALAPFEDRYRMCELAAQALGPRVKVSDIERRLGGESRTLRTVQALRADHPDLELALVIGSDLEAETSTWYGADELRQSVSFIVVGRAGFVGPGARAAVAMPAISSTEIRERLLAGGAGRAGAASDQPGEGAPAVEALLPRAVLDYIRQRGLYGVIDSP